MRWHTRRRPLAVIVAVAVALAVAAGAGSLIATGGSHPAGHRASAAVSSAADIGNTQRPGATAGEPSMAVSGAERVVVFQEGRGPDGGSRAIGFSASSDGGATWHTGVLPGMTRASGGRSALATNATVAYDAVHGRYVATALTLVPDPRQPGTPQRMRGVDVLVSTSRDGIDWSDPVVALHAVAGAAYDRPRLVSGPDGVLYIAVDSLTGQTGAGIGGKDLGGEVIVLSSHDGGAAWSAGVTIPGARALGVQPVVRADGTLVVVAMNARQTLTVFTSHDHGATWDRGQLLDRNVAVVQNGSLSAQPFPAAAASGNAVYALWQHIGGGSAADELNVRRVGDTSPAVRLPITLKAGEAFVFPSIAADGSRLAVVYGVMSWGATPGSGALQWWGVRSSDGGAAWTSPEKLTGASPVADFPTSRLDAWAGDGVSVVWSSRGPLTVVPVAARDSGGSAMWLRAVGLPPGRGDAVRAWKPSLAPAIPAGVPALGGAGGIA